MSSRRRSRATTRRSTKGRSKPRSCKSWPRRQRPDPRDPAPIASKASILAIEKGASLSEVLTYLVNEVSQYVDRAVMFIVKGTNVIGWAARGVHPPDAARAISVPAERRHGLSDRPERQARASRTHQPLARHRAGAGASRRQPAGRSRDPADPARQARRHPLLRLEPGGGAAAGRRPDRDPGPLRLEDDRPALARRPRPRSARRRCPRCRRTRRRLLRDRRQRQWRHRTRAPSRIRPPTTEARP